MTLYDGQVDRKYIIEEIRVVDNVARRLEALGLNEGTKIDILNKKNKGAMIVKVRGTRLALGERILSEIIVKETK
jgi:ferrous iron transport protein A